MAMINYSDKVALNSNSGIADVNKVKADDMNELKNAFNNQVAFGWYKTGLNPTFTFVSYDSDTLTGVVNSNLDLTSYLSVGMKVKFTQNSAIKYAFITAISTTQLTLFLGTDYTINNSAISNTYFSMLKSPYGFPTNPNKWSLFKLITNDYIFTDTASATFISFKGINLSLPIGCWKLIFSGTSYSDRVVINKNCLFTLSTTLTSETNTELTTRLDTLVAGALNSMQFYKESILSVDTLTTFNLLYVSPIVVGLLGYCYIKAVCEYL